MGDHRLSVEMTLVGADGVQREHSMWLNWHEDRPADVLQAVMNLANKSQLPANCPDCIITAIPEVGDE